ncbi:MFS transporter [Actinocorallia sp. A-T 12471]|uniref:MFS transporter n=1 Tax=Actinocorallia sp. A-T 12471 TaxID=3089813 RepID=UPI0029D2767B|nr:MFS transporter [Actinocorallia sp. A-T 12471]MDX6740300.1 MFS transporter [Actinocorallia sp. A-T 12471]
MSIAEPATKPGFLTSRNLALGVLSATGLMTILDGSIVTVALPVLQRELGFSAVGLSWTVNAYLIAFGGLLLLSGRLGDLIGRKRMFLTGNAVFTAASVLAGLANGPELLLAARFAQGVGSAMASAVVLGIIVTLFTEPGERAKAIAVFSFTGAVGASLGQVLGGLLTDLLAWNWIFLINLPIGLAVVALAVPALPNDRGSGLAQGADVLGAVLVTSGLMLGIYTVVGVERYGWLAGRTLGLGALALALIVGFVIRQATVRNPLMPLRVLRSRAVAVANVAQMFALSGMFAFQILVALYMQRVLGYSPLETGLAMLPAAILIGTVSLFVSARLSARIGLRATLLGGLALLFAAMLWLTRVPVDASYVTDLLPVMLLIAGGGLVLPSLASLGMSGAREDDAGLASGLFTTTQQIGMAFGVAVLSTLAAARTESHLASGTPLPEALTTGYHLAFATSAGLLLTAAALSLLLPRTPTPAAPTPTDPAIPPNPDLPAKAA